MIKQQSGNIPLKILIGSAFAIISALYAISLYSNGSGFKAWLVGCLSIGAISWLFSDKPCNNRLNK